MFGSWDFPLQSSDQSGNVTLTQDGPNWLMYSRAVQRSVPIGPTGILGFITRKTANERSKISRPTTNVVCILLLFAFLFVERLWLCRKWNFFGGRSEFKSYTNEYSPPRDAGRSFQIFPITFDFLYTLFKSSTFHVPNCRPVRGMCRVEFSRIIHEHACRPRKVSHCLLVSL